jgi:hypothetical protein
MGFLRLDLNQVFSYFESMEQANTCHKFVSSKEKNANNKQW